MAAMLKAAGRQHAQIAETGFDGVNQTVRGMFSLSEMAPQLGVTMASCAHLPILKLRLVASKPPLGEGHVRQPAGIQCDACARLATGFRLC